MLRALKAKVKYVILLIVRKLQLLAEEARTIRFAGNGIKIFNLDLHISVIEDLSCGLPQTGVTLAKWSISRHNHLIPSMLPVSDPVAFVNVWNWPKKFTDKKIRKFRTRYKKFLSQFDGFIVTYAPSTIALFREHDVPKLIVVPTRYEAPFTADPVKWRELDKSLVDMAKHGNVTIVANNVADADYLKYFTGLRAEVIPSLCEKEGEKWSQKNEKRLILGRATNLVHEISASTLGEFVDVRSLGDPYDWRTLLGCAELFVLPQNVSLMTLFELATAGVPVAVPDKAWMMALRKSHESLLGELTYFEMNSLDCGPLSLDNPCNYKSPNYLEWWLDRADFYDSSLMPNVRVVSGIEDLCQGRPASFAENYDLIIEKRNRALREKRRLLMSKFIDDCRQVEH